MEGTPGAMGRPSSSNTPSSAAVTTGDGPNPIPIATGTENPNSPAPIATSTWWTSSVFTVTQTDHGDPIVITGTYIGTIASPTVSTAAITSDASDSTNLSTRSLLSLTSSFPKTGTATQTNTVQLQTTSLTTLYENTSPMPLTASSTIPSTLHTTSTPIPSSQVSTRTTSTQSTFPLPPLASSTATTSPPNSTATSHQSLDTSLSLGAKLGISLGTSLASIIGVILALLLIKHRRRSKARKAMHGPAAAANPDKFAPDRYGPSELDTAAKSAAMSPMLEKGVTGWDAEGVIRRSELQGFVPVELEGRTRPYGDSRGQHQTQVYEVM